MLYHSVKKMLASAILACAFAGSVAALELPEIIGTDMMLQQQSKARLWGWAKAGSTVSVRTSWDEQTYSARADRQTGRWELQVATPAASYTPQTMTVQGDGEEIRIENVLIGEVWFCSGQSNMEMTLGGFWNCPIEGANEAIAGANQYKKAIRVATIARTPMQEPADRTSGRWQECTTAQAPSFTACGYFFARTLTDLLDVPVGIINCSWGGSCVEGWLPKDTLLTYPDGITPFNDADYMQKMVMYNGMVHPLAGYTIRGFLWNQGESNIGREKDYAARFKAMVRHWRKLWRQPGDNLPIYTVELPPYWYGNGDDTNGAALRQVQHQIARELEHSGCVCTTDLILEHEARQIHGCKKLEIGQRLAYMAATRDYGMEGIAAEAPEFERMEAIEMDPGLISVIAGTPVEQHPDAKGKVMRLYFSNSQDGFDRMDGIEGFEAAGADGVWHKAIVWAGSDWRNPKYQGCFLDLVCPEAGEVKHVRYCFKNWTSGRLHNLRGLPVVPFSTEM